MKTDEIRKAYLSFFESKGHRICASDSLVPGNDPTLLFTGAGMNQFKDQFMGLGKIEFRRATTAQKCIRTGDIMNVGVTPAHHTFFEMMGNFSFGDYFKAEAITWAWEFLTGVMKLPERLLQVTVYETDDEAFEMWHKKVGLPANKITRLGAHDNFWPADAPTLGPNGPCGPCSEIFFDRGEQRGCGKPDCGVTCACRRHVEIWNLVFTQFDRQSDGSLPPLPQKNIDTGMGLERMAACMQDANTNMDIDIFVPIVAAVAEAAGKKYGVKREDDVLMRRVADHARAVTFCIADGVLPANTHRGYVLKRLLRRAVLDGRTLGIGEAFMHKLSPIVAKVMGGQYPEVVERGAFITEQMTLEEGKFRDTLDRGLTLIDMAVKKAKDKGNAVVDGATAFELYDTYGFPYELAEEVVGREGLALDREGFKDSMEAARRKAREGAKMKGDIFAKGPLAEVKKLTGGTAFLGYDKLESSAKVIAIIKGDACVQEASAGSEVQVVLDQSPLYAESGGQVGDTGVIVGSGHLICQVIDALKVDGIFLHVCQIESGSIKVGQEVNCSVDETRRAAIARHHTATHLLHWALREVVGDRAQQKGSWVGPDRLRFDFQQAKALAPEELERVEELVSAKILENQPVSSKEMPIAEAKAKGAMALFGEKYGERVRLVEAGEFSKELCGGTHAKRTGDIGPFRILSEGAIAAGIRRIEACTGMAAWRAARNDGELVRSLAEQMKAPAADLAARVTAMQDEQKRLRKELDVFKEKALREKLADLAGSLQDVDGIPYAALDLGNVGGKELRGAAESARKSIQSGAVLFGGAEDGKAALACFVTADLQAKGIKAGDIIKRAAEIIGGTGGGKPDLAQAGGKHPEKISEAMAALPGIIKSLAGGK